MRKFAVPQTRVPGAKRRIHPITLLPEVDNHDTPLWDMDRARIVRYAEHRLWRKHKRTGKRLAEPVQVPVYRGTSASFARYMKAQLRRMDRKRSEERSAALRAQAKDKKAVAEQNLKEIEELITNVGGDYGAEDAELEGTTEGDGPDEAAVGADPST